MVYSLFANIEFILLLLWNKYAFFVGQSRLFLLVKAGVKSKNLVGGTRSNVVGTICPLVLIGLTDLPIAGRANTPFPPILPSLLVMCKHAIHMMYSKLISFIRNSTEILSKGSFNNYLDELRGEGVRKCLFLSTLRV